jgi:hypothetical protein
METGMPVSDVTRLLDISEQTLFRGGKLYAGLRPGQTRELKQPQK